METSDEIKVSIACRAFNHERYIRQCLDGFVMQKTNFRYEVLIHDDASTDHTADIIREYELRYPDIIKPIYQTENQYSKGVQIEPVFLWPKAQGKYIAICEGDDYWSDENKLQRQFDFMETHPDYAACVHCAIAHSEDGRLSDQIFPLIHEDRDYSLEEIIGSGGGLFATNSLFRRKDQVIAQPECFYAKGFRDYQAFIYAAMCGKVRCLKEVMTVYNSGAVGSWTQIVWRDKEKRIAHLREKSRMLRAVDEYYEYKYHDLLQKQILDTESWTYLEEGNKEMMKKEPYKTICKAHVMQQRKNRIRKKLDKYMPNVVNTILKIKHGAILKSE